MITEAGFHRRGHRARLQAENGLGQLGRHVDLAAFLPAQVAALRGGLAVLGVGARQRGEIRARFDGLLIQALYLGLRRRSASAGRGNQNMTRAPPFRRHVAHFVLLVQIAQIVVGHDHLGSHLGELQFGVRKTRRLERLIVGCMFC